MGIRDLVHILMCIVIGMVCTVVGFYIVCTIFYLIGYIGVHIFDYTINVTAETASKYYMLCGVVLSTIFTIYFVIAIITIMLLKNLYKIKSYISTRSNKKE